VRDVLRFAVPAGTAAGLGVLSAYTAAKQVWDLDQNECYTVATTVLVIVGLYLILALEASNRLRGAAVTTLCLALAGLYVLILALPGTRHFYAFGVPGPLAILSAVGGSALSITGLALTDDRFIPRAILDWGNPPATEPEKDEPVPEAPAESSA
jgi:hypothetical protein